MDRTDDFDHMVHHVVDTHFSCVQKNRVLRRYQRRYSPILIFEIPLLQLLVNFFQRSLRET